MAPVENFLYLENKPSCQQPPLIGHIAVGSLPTAQSVFDRHEQQQGRPANANSFGGAKRKSPAPRLWFHFSEDFSLSRSATFVRKLTLGWTLDPYIKRQTNPIIRNHPQEGLNRHCISGRLMARPSRRQQKLSN
jgi:hypothetical protein